MQNKFQLKEIFRSCTPTEKLNFLHKYEYVQNIMDLLVMLNFIRDRHKDVIFTVTSWCRDNAHNKRVNGSSTSQHMTGSAVDFHVDYVDGSRNHNFNTRVWNDIHELCTLGVIKCGQCILYENETGHFIHLSLPGSHVNHFFKKQS